MYQVITYDFEMIKTVQVETRGVHTAKDVYSTLVKRCIYGFPDIQIVQIVKDGEVKTEFINWRR